LCEEEVEVMNAVIIIAALFCGAVDVGPPTESNPDMSGVAPPTTSIPLQPELRDAMQRQQRTPTRGVPASRLHNVPASAARESNTMPAAPTGDSEEQQYNWTAPTAGAAGSSGSQGGGRPSGFYGRSKLPYSPTHPRPGQAMSNAAMQDAQLQRMRIEAASQLTAPVQQTSKAYSGTPMNTGGVSPYMNLYRSGTNGVVDNYTTLVRPELDQRRTNQQFGTDIRGLENSARVQGFSLNQLNRSTQNLQGVKYQQFFMNYGDFYPNAR
jgi:hypothetical protein